MGIFARKKKSTAENSLSTSGGRSIFHSGRSSSGTLVNEETALQTAPVYACVRVISETIASLPLHVYEYTDTGTKLLRDHYLFPILHDIPNPEMTSFNFRETLMTHLLLYGNAYAQIVRNGAGRVEALYPLLPNKMDVHRNDAGELYYTYWRERDDTRPDDKTGAVVLRRDQVLHIASLSMRQLSRVITTSSGELHIPVVASTGTASWVAEGNEIPLSDGTFGQVILTAYKIGTMIKVTHELLKDSAFPIDSFLAQDFGRRMGQLEEEAFVAGDGINKPTGFLTSAPVGKVVGSPTALSFDDVMDLYRKLRSPYRNKAVFVANDLTIGALQKLKDNNGQYLWKPALTMGEPDTILGRPVYVSSFMPAIGPEAKVLAFGDFSYYWIGDRTGRTFERLNELFAQTDQVGFKATQRVDGKLVLPEAIQVMQMGAA